MYVSVIIPTYNEAQNLSTVLPRLSSSYEVILVDGGSTDGTVEIAKVLRPDVKVVEQTHAGKGNALLCGFEKATGRIIVMLDADGSADPGEIPRFIDALTQGADVAKGSRFTPGGGSDDITPVRWLGNRFLTGVMNLLYGTRYTDLCYGLNVFWSEVLEDVSDMAGRDLGFEVEALLHCRWTQANRRVVEVASHESRRVYGSSNLSAIRDGIRVLRTILRERHSAPYSIQESINR